MNRWMYVLVMVGGVGVVLPLTTYAEEETATDRPDFTETSISIERGRLQIETGATFEREADVDAKRGPELMVRVGVLPRTEFRIGYNHQWESFEGDGQNSGLFHVGTKVQLAPNGAPWGASVIPTLAWSAIETGFEETDADASFGLIFTWARDLNEKWSLGGVVGPVWDGIDGEGDDTVFATVSAGTNLDPRVGTFLEWAGEFPQVSGESRHVLHHGYTYLMATNAQFDIHGGVGLTDASADWFVGVGLSYRAPN